MVNIRFNLNKCPKHTVTSVIYVIYRMTIRNGFFTMRHDCICLYTSYQFWLKLNSFLKIVQMSWRDICEYIESSVECFGEGPREILTNVYQIRLGMCGVSLLTTDVTETEVHWGTDETGAPTFTGITDRSMSVNVGEPMPSVLRCISVSVTSVSVIQYLHRHRTCLNPSRQFIVVL